MLRAQGQPKAFSLQSRPKQIFVKSHEKKDQATKDKEDVKASGVRRRMVGEETHWEGRGGLLDKNTQQRLSTCIKFAR